MGNISTNSTNSTNSCNSNITYPNDEYPCKFESPLTNHFQLPPRKFENAFAFKKATIQLDLTIFHEVIITEEIKLPIKCMYMETLHPGFRAKEMLWSSTIQSLIIPYNPENIVLYLDNL